MGQTATVGAAAGSTPPASAVAALSRDDCGQVQIGTGGSGTGAGLLCTIGFAGNYSSPDMPAAPKILLSPGSAACSGLGFYVSAQTSHGFAISCTGTPPTGQLSNATGIVVNWWFIT